MENLKKILNRQDKILYKRLEELKEIITPKLENIKIIFPEYTRHDITHSETVIRNLDEIISDSIKKQLDKYSIYFLLCAAYLHDIGMNLLRDDIIDEKIKELIDNEEKLKVYIRDNHHIRSEIYVKNKYPFLKIDNYHEANIIGKICKGHRKLDLSEYDPDYKYNHSSNIFSINIAFLSSFLRIADELDISYERVPLKNGIIVLPEDKISQEHWNSHLTISGIGKVIDDPLIIRCSVNCKDSHIHRVLKNLESKINEEIKDLPNYIGHYRSLIKELPRSFIMDIEPEGYIPYDFKFTLQGKKIINFLTNQLYNDKGVAIRELIKNSLDTCRHKRSIYQKEHRQYIPIINFSLNEGRDRIIVSDNGLGMDKFIITNYLTIIGQTYYDSPEFKKEELNFTPVSELGIGILSYFLIGNRIIIETKKDDKESIKIEINNIDDYFIVSPSQKQDSGTTIIIDLKVEFYAKIADMSFYYNYENYIGSEHKGLFLYDKLYLEEELIKYARHIEFPITLSHKGYVKTIIDKGYEFNNIDDEVFIYQFKIKNDIIEGIILIFQSDINHKLKFVYGKDLEKLHDFSKTCSYEGIYINEFPFPFTSISSRCLNYDLNFKSKSIDLNIARDYIILNEKFYATRKTLENLILKKLSDFFKKYLTYLKKNGLNIELHIRKFFHDYLIFPKDDSHTDLIKNYYFFRLIEEKNIIFKKFEEIIKHKDKLIIIKYTKEVNDDLIRKLFENWKDFDISKIYLLSDLEFPEEIDEKFCLYYDLEKKEIVKDKPQIIKVAEKIL